MSQHCSQVGPALPRERGVVGAPVKPSSLNFDSSTVIMVDDGLTICARALVQWLTKKQSASRRGIIGLTVRVAYDVWFIVLHKLCQQPDSVYSPAHNASGEKPFPPSESAESTHRSGTDTKVHSRTKSPGSAAGQHPRPCSSAVGPSKG